jgi:type VI secretion system secreted protein VgrG
LRPAAYAIEAMAGQSGAGSYSVITTGLMRFEAGGSHAVDVTTFAHERVGDSKTINVGEDYTLSVTGHSKETAGKRKVIDAHEEIMLRCGRAVLRMKADGSITLNGKRLDIGQADAMVVKAGRIDLN